MKTLIEEPVLTYVNLCKRLNQLLVAQQRGIVLLLFRSISIIHSWSTKGNSIWDVMECWPPWMVRWKVTFTKMDMCERHARSSITTMWLISLFIWLMMRSKFMLTIMESLRVETKWLLVTSAELYQLKTQITTSTCTETSCLKLKN